jgi:hypothetical protein
VCVCACACVRVFWGGGRRRSYVPDDGSCAAETCRLVRKQTCNLGCFGQEPRSCIEDYVADISPESAKSYKIGEELCHQFSTAEKNL